MSTKDENGKIVKNTTPIKSRKRMSKVQSPNGTRSPSPKKQRRVSFAPSKTVYQEEKKDVKRSSMVPVSLKERRKLVIPEDEENIKEKKPIQETKKEEKRNSFIDSDNLAAFRQELENLSDSSESDKESENENSFAKGKEKTLLFEDEGNMELTCSGPDFGKIIAQAKEQLKKHQESLNKPTETSIYQDTRFSITQTTQGKNMEFTEPIGKVQIVDKTEYQGRMSMTQGNYGKIIIEEKDRSDSMDLGDLDQSTPLNQSLQDSNLSIEDSPEILGKSIIGNSKMSLTKNLGGKILLEEENKLLRKSIIGEQRMSMTKDDFGKIQMEKDKSIGRFSVSAKERLSKIFEDESIDFGSRKSLIGESKMSMTKDDFGKIQIENKEKSRKSIIEEQRMSMTNDDLGKIQIENKEKSKKNLLEDENKEKSRKSIIEEQRMSITNDDLGKIQIEKNSKNIIGEEMSMTNENFGNINVNIVDHSRKSIIGEERMSMTNNEGKILNSEKKNTEQRISSSSEDFGNISYEKIEGGRKSIISDQSMSTTDEETGNIQVEIIDNDRKSIVGELRMSLDHEIIGKIEMEKRKSILEVKSCLKNQKEEKIEDVIEESSRRKSISDKLKNIKKDEMNSRQSIGDRMSLVKEDFSKITLQNKSRKSIIERNNDMSITLNDYGNRLFGVSDESEEEKIQEEKFERPEDLLKMMNDSISLDVSKDILSKSPIPQKEDKKTETFTLNLTDTKKDFIPESTPTIEKKKQIIRNTPQLTPSQKLIKSVQNLAEPKNTKTARSLNEKIESVKDETMEIIKETPMIRIQSVKKELEEEIRENSKSIDISSMRMTVSDFLFITNIRFLDDLSNQKRPTSSIGFIKSKYNGNTQNDRLESIYFIKSELEAYEKACDDICEISEGIKVNILKLETQMNKRNPKIFLDINCVTKDELIEINVSFI